MNTAVFILTLIALGLAAPAHRISVPPASTSNRAIEARVWSNDDVNYLREKAPISIIGVVTPTLAAGSAKEPPPCEGPYVKESDPAWYSEQIELRREQIAQIDWQLAHIAAVEDGGRGISNAFPFEGTNPGILLPGTVYSLQQQEQGLRLEVADLQDLAHAREIPREAWR